MKIERTEVIWLESQSHYTARDLANLSGLPIELLHDLMERGALPASSGPGDARFEAECIALVRAARRLRDDFELDVNGLAVAVSLLRRMHTLEARLAEAQARGAAIVEERDADAN